MKARGRNGGLVDLLDLHIGAGLLPELLQHLTGVASARRRGDEHLEFDRLAVILDQRLGLLDIVGQRAVILALDPRAVAIGIGGRPGQAIGERLRHLLAIERHHQRLAHAHIVERRDLGVEGVDRGAGPGIGVHGQLGVLLRLLDVVGVVFVVPDEIGLARLQAGEARLRVRQRLQDDAVEIDLPLSQ